MTNTSDSTATKFPSPCGDYGSYRGLFLELILFNKWLFPSPCGDYGSYRVTETFQVFPADHRFRPLAGIMVLIKEQNHE